MLSRIHLSALVVAPITDGSAFRVPAVAGPAEEANAALDAFSGAYLPNDVDKLVQLSAPNTILRRTNSPIISTGGDVVRTYFTNLKLAGSGNKKVIQERKTIVVSDNIVVVTKVPAARSNCVPSLRRAPLYTLARMSIGAR